MKSPLPNPSPARPEAKKTTPEAEKAPPGGESQAKPPDSKEKAAQLEASLTAPEKRLVETDDEVKSALERAVQVKPSAAVGWGPRLRLLGRVVVVLLLAGAYAVVRYRLVAAEWLTHPWVSRTLLLAILFLSTLTLGRLMEVYWVDGMKSAVHRYNLRRVVRLLAFLVIGLGALSILFQSWYTAAVSLGLFSLVLGFALQTPITSFIGWIYVLVRKPYQVGDRIRIGEATGDVIEVGYLDTTLWEVGGQYLSTDHPSGRIVKFPNSNVLSNPVFNYSWPLFPFIWNEVKFQLAYDSDLEFVGRVMQEEAAKEIGEEMMERVRVFRDLLAKTPVDQLTVQEQPVMVFRVSENTWLEAIVRYLVDPKEAGRVKTDLIQRMLERLNAEPEKAKFPKSNMR